VSPTVSLCNKSDFLCSDIGTELRQCLIDQLFRVNRETSHQVSLI
jgi:hypothetical protein